MTWREHIQSDPQILDGKPVVKGSRLAVGFLLGLLAEGWTQDQLLQNYPQLSPESLRAVFAYASETLQDDTVFPLDLGAA